MHVSTLFAPVLLTLAVSATPVPQTIELLCPANTQVLACCSALDNLASDSLAGACDYRKLLHLA